MVEVAGAALDVNAGLGGEFRDSFAYARMDVVSGLVRSEKDDEAIPLDFTCSLTGFEAISAISCGFRIDVKACYSW